MLAVIAGYRRKLVENPTPLTPISPRIPVCHHRHQLVTPAMLIRLIISPTDQNRSGANQMRQHLSFREHFRRGNAGSVAGCATKGGRSPTGVANLATGGAPQGAVFSGGRGRPIASGFFTR